MFLARRILLVGGLLAVVGLVILSLGEGFLALATSQSDGAGKSVKQVPEPAPMGRVKVVGSAYNAKTVLVPEGSKIQKLLCAGELSKRVSRLSGMTIKAEGSWFKGSAKSIHKNKCFDVTGFSIEKAPSGRKPLVGTLLRDNAGFYSVASEDGKKYKLQRVTSGLKKLMGEKVIVDVKQMATSKTGSWKVVSYSRFP